MGINKIIDHLYYICSDTPHCVHHNKQEERSQKPLQRSRIHQTIVSTNGKKCSARQTIAASLRMYVHICMYIHTYACTRTYEIFIVCTKTFKLELCPLALPVRFPRPWNAAIGTKSKESPMLQKESLILGKKNHKNRSTPANWNYRTCRSTTSTDSLINKRT